MITVYQLLFCCVALLYSFLIFCKDWVMSSISLLVVLLTSLRAIVSFSDRSAGGSMVSSEATDWASNLMHSSSSLGLCGVRIDLHVVSQLLL